MDTVKKNNQYSAIIIGFILIALVFIYTLYNPRSENIDLDPEKNTLPNEETAQYTQITLADFKTRLRQDKNWLVVDIRLARDFQAGHIIDSINWPYNELSEKKLAQDANHNLLIINYGQNAEEKINNTAAAKLKTDGFNNVFFLTGGFNEWEQRGEALISAGNEQSFTDQAKVSFISADDLTAVLAQDEIIYLLDVRPSTAFNLGRLKNAVNIPLAELEKRRKEISTKQDIVVYGDNAQDGFHAGVRLYDLNFFSVRVLEQGFANWNARGLEIVK